MNARHRTPALLLTGLLVLTACGSGGGDDGDDADGSPVVVPTVSIAPTTIVERDANDPGDPDVVCAELQTVQDLSDEVSESVNEILSSVAGAGADGQAEALEAFVDLAEDIEDGLPELLGAYDRAAAAASADVASEIRAVADGTAVLTPALAAGLRSAADDGEFAAINDMLSEPELADASQRAGIASLRLDNFTNPTCGFQFSNS